ncbi:GTP pyrophosphokinase [Nocardioides plantarum]|uniref:GTP pyrophosphokinase family protein n=1 Tax=Nocardioides plantarum TaxID=29299 RepID=A0ABV5KD70_9ACTN|nr:RelA/SpoT domain-containing protein [Nocardioides plantarum]
MIDEADAIVRQYEIARADYEALAIRIRQLLLDLLKGEGLDIIQIESRAKSTESLRDKLSDKGDAYSDLGDITDLCGVRVITYYLEDVDVVESLLAREFEVDESNSVDKSKQLKWDQFGYLSRHYILQLKSPRTTLAEWQPCQNLKFEVQVRTSLQHAWAAVNHKLDYKNESSVPSELRRTLHRLSALFEIADSQFSDLRRSVVELAASYAKSVDDGDLSAELNADSLDAYFDRSPVYSRARASVEAVGEPLLPHGAQPFQTARDRSDLLEFFKLAGMTQLLQVDEWLHQLVSDSTLLKVVSEVEAGPRRAINLDDFLSQALAVERPEVDDFYEEVYGTPDDWLPRARALLQERRTAQ